MSSYYEWRMANRRVEAAEAKLQRIADWLYGIHCDLYRSTTISLFGLGECWDFYNARDTVLKCKQDVRNEWRERQESWL